MIYFVMIQKLLKQSYMGYPPVRLIVAFPTILLAMFAKATYFVHCLPAIFGLHLRPYKNNAQNCAPSEKGEGCPLNFCDPKRMCRISDTLFCCC